MTREIAGSSEGSLSFGSAISLIDKVFLELVDIAKEGIEIDYDKITCSIANITHSLEKSKNRFV